MHEFDKITLARRANKCDWRLDGKNQCEIDQVQKLAYFLLEEVPTDVNGLLPHERAHLTERISPALCGVPVSREREFRVTRLATPL